MSELRRKTSAFTRVELVVLGCVIGIIAAVAIANQPPRRHTSSKNSCINNLRQLDGAKQQWALENHKDTNSVPTLADVLPFLKNSQMPKCPDGGKYNLGRVSEDPTCSKPLHVLPAP